MGSWALSPIHLPNDVIVEVKPGTALKTLSSTLEKQRVIQHFNFKMSLFTLAQRANGDCLYLDARSRLCTIYDKRPDTCRNHPKIGPRPGFCAYTRNPLAKRSPA